MNELPVAIGLSVCELVIQDASTGHPSLINRVTRLRVRSFPTPPQRLSVFAALTNGFGDIPIRIEVEPPDGGMPIRERTVVVDFTDRLDEVWFVVELNDLVFPEPGAYQVSLFAETEPLARSLLRVFPVTGDES